MQGISQEARSDSRPMGAATVRLSRRQALGMAAGGAAGAVALRFGLMHLGSSGIAASAGPNGAWASPLGSSRALAAHLLRRAGFGYTSADLDAAASMKYDDLVEQLLAQKPDSLPMPANVDSYQAVVQAWYAQMATTQAQFPERMTLFWHGLLTSDYRKAARFPFVFQQNVLYREQGRSDLRSLLVATTYDPLMGRYLDLDQSSGKAPNENYSRELMELYTLGVGNYTEDDVREGARALSGIRARLRDSNGNLITPPKFDKNNPAATYTAIAKLYNQGARYQGELLRAQHDNGSKTFLGKTGNLGPEDVIDIILAQPSCAPYITNKALQYFAVPSPSNDYIDRLATQFRASKYDVTTLMRAIFQSPEFKDPSNYRSLVRSPADYMVATMRALQRSDLAKQCVTAGGSMDQTLYDMPTVAGWPVNAAWLSSSSLLGRVNFASTVVASQKTFPDLSAAVHDQLDGVVGSDTASVINASSTDTDRWYALLASPEFHLK